jgi:hypothetical protein
MWQGGNRMTDTQTVSPASQLHVETIEGASYEVVSNYIGDISLLDLFKQMLKRDLERLED